jgi:hypothetical protein
MVRKDSPEVSAEKLRNARDSLHKSAAGEFYDAVAELQARVPNRGLKSS